MATDVGVLITPFTVQEKKFFFLTIFVSVSMFFLGRHSCRTCSDPVAHWLRTNDLVEAPSGQCQQPMLKFADSVKQVVIHVGTHKKPLVCGERKGCQAIGFETNVDHFSTPVYQDPRLVMVPAAVTHCPGIAVFNVDKITGGNHGQLGPVSAVTAAKSISQKLVPAVTLASILSLIPPHVRISLLKVDARGYDLTVIKSAGKSIERVEEILVDVDLSVGDAFFHDHNGQGRVERYMHRVGFKPVAWTCKENPDLTEADFNQAGNVGCKEAVMLFEKL